MELEKTFGKMRCIFCHNKLPLCNEYPTVGSFIYCTVCKNFMIIQDRYLEYNGDTTFKIRMLTPSELDKVTKYFIENPMDDLYD